MVFPRRALTASGRQSARTVRDTGFCSAGLMSNSWLPGRHRANASIPRPEPSLGCTVVIGWKHSPERAMSDVSRTEVASSIAAKDPSAVSWAAVIAGALTAAALTLVLLAFGAGMGFSAVSPWPSSGLCATTFKIATGLYLIVVAMLSSTLGGYIAGRLRTKWTGLHSEEVLFRDTAHGFLAWAVATAFGAA